MSVGEPRNYYKRFSYLVEIDGFVYFGFQTCSELQVEAAVVEQWEGGAVIPDKSPGRLTVSDITLERGATSDPDAYAWFTEVVNMASGNGKVYPEYKRNLDIVQLDRDGSELERWTVVNAWPRQFTAGSWDNTADETRIETLVLACDYFKKAEAAA